MSTPFRQSTELSSSQQEQELAIWRNLKPRCLGILCRVPVLQLAFDPLLSHLPTQRSPSLLLHVIRQSPLEGKKPASMSVIQLWECRAISVKSIFKENCSGCHWGHLGVCVLCSNCFISAEKNLLVTMILQLTVALWKESISSKNEGVYWWHTHQLFSGLLSPTYRVSSKHLVETRLLIRQEVHEDTAFSSMLCKVDAT